MAIEQTFSGLGANALVTGGCRSVSGAELDKDRSGIPYTDADSAQILGEALERLAAIRSPFGVADPGAVLSAIVSLGAEADVRLEDAVADARAAGYDWSAIADRLAAVNARAVRRRYGAYCRWREEGCPLPITF
jgi:hypothetical protein